MAASRHFEFLKIYIFYLICLYFTFWLKVIHEYLIYMFYYQYNSDLMRFIYTFVENNCFWDWYIVKICILSRDNTMINMFIYLLILWCKWQYLCILMIFVFFQIHIVWNSSVKYLENDILIIWSLNNEKNLKLPIIQWEFFLLNKIKAMVLYKICYRRCLW